MASSRPIVLRIMLFRKNNDAQLYTIRAWGRRADRRR